MIEIYETLTAAQTARKELPTLVRGFAYRNYIRKTLDGKFAVISIPESCWLSSEALARYNLPSTTLGLFDEGEPQE